MTYLEALKAAARGVPNGILDKDSFKEVVEGFIPLIIWVSKVVFTLTFPISIPILAYIYKVTEARQKRRKAAEWAEYLKRRAEHERI